MVAAAPTSGVQLVVVSPLMRALETAAGVFGTDPGSAPSSMDADAGGDAAQQQQQQQQQGGLRPFMVAQGAEPGVRVAHGALTLPPGLHVLANELCRERLGASLGGAAPTRVRGRPSHCCPVSPSLLPQHAAPCWAPSTPVCRPLAMRQAAATA